MPIQIAPKEKGFGKDGYIESWVMRPLKDVELEI